ncbi:hypothetical protein NQ314_003325 [Rhamnusium bicolor]|uniref:Uncharacterized protein n=1 Tax=Rhamnusium bicolor TaxID=1586634 RepID=A0AAV8ZMP7_9CUCU|nr:hypothetical protein NQ314_003325 [Rhamnusium bicolor]
MFLTNEKSVKVKFREKLISFEPDLTDDDVNSIESDHVEVLVDNRPLILEYETTINNDTNIFNSKEALEEKVEEIIEDIESDCDVVGIQNIEPYYVPEEKSSVVTTKEGNNVINNTMTIISLPPLQLLQRKCCDKSIQNLHKNLPNYNGLRSEYGLSSKQLENRERQKEINKLREQTHRQLIEQYRNRKIHQNEKVFCQWLKDVSKRKSEKKYCMKQKVKNAKYPDHQVNHVSHVSSKYGGKIKERPKSANQFVPKINIKKPRRPHTTHSCVYIEVPESLLQQGLSIGDFTITTSKLTKKIIF